MCRPWSFSLGRKSGYCDKVLVCWLKSFQGESSIGGTTCVDTFICWPKNVVVSIVDCVPQEFTISVLLGKFVPLYQKVGCILEAYHSKTAWGSIRNWKRSNMELYVALTLFKQSTNWVECYSPPSSVITKACALLNAIPLPSTATTVTLYSVYSSSSVISDAVTFPDTISPTGSLLLLAFLARAT